MAKKNRRNRDGKERPQPLMPRKEIRVRAEGAFSAMPLGLQEAYLIMMAANLARAKGGNLRISGACLDDQ